MNCHLQSSEDGTQWVCPDCCRRLTKRSETPPRAICKPGRLEGRGVPGEGERLDASHRTDQWQAEQLAVCQACPGKQYDAATDACRLECPCAKVSGLLRTKLWQCRRGYWTDERINEQRRKLGI